jgi:rhodanese-related sulfurtransferase
MENKETILQQLTPLVEEQVENFPDSNWIRLSDYLAQRTEGVWILVDARSPEEREISIIPDAVTTDECMALLESNKEASILVYCTVGGRSGGFSSQLIKDGYHAHNLWGGVLAWALEGKLFINPGGIDTARVHVYGEKWNVLPDGYESIVLDE